MRSHSHHRRRRRRGRETGSRGGALQHAALQNDRSALVETARNGMAAGTIGAAVAGCWMMIAVFVTGSPVWLPFRAVSGLFAGMDALSVRVPDPVGVVGGVAIYWLAAATCGIIYAYAAGITATAFAPLGLAYGLVLWLFTQCVVLPTSRPELAAAIHPFVVAVSFLTYGLVVGYTFPMISDRSHSRDMGAGSTPARRR